MYKKGKKVKLINHDCVPILMPYIMLAYLMLFAALSNAVCLHNAFFAIDFLKYFLFSCCLGLLTQFVYFTYDLASCAVLLICWFFLIPCSHKFF